MPVLKALPRRGAPDDDLLTFRDGREWHDLVPEHVNGWIKETIGEQFSAKDFRTWNATVVAAQFLAEHDGEAPTKAAKKRIGNETVAKSRSSSTTRPRSAAPPTSIPASSTASTPARRSRRHCGAFSGAPGAVASSTARR